MRPTPNDASATSTTGRSVVARRCPSARIVSAALVTTYLGQTLLVGSSSRSRVARNAVFFPGPFPASQLVGRQPPPVRTTFRHRFEHSENQNQGPSHGWPVPRKSSERL